MQRQGRAFRRIASARFRMQTEAGALEHGERRGERWERR